MHGLVGEADAVDVLLLVALVKILNLPQAGLETTHLFVQPGSGDQRDGQRTEHDDAPSRPPDSFLVDGLPSHGFVVMVEVDSAGNGGEYGERMKSESVFVYFHELGLFLREGSSFGGKNIVAGVSDVSHPPHELLAQAHCNLHMMCTII